MTQDLLTNVGEEWYTEHDISSLTLVIGVYNDGSHSSGDNLSVTDDMSAINTEPGNTNYGRVNETVTPAVVSGDGGIENDSQFSFDFTDITSEQWVDTFFIAYSFDSDRAGDGGTASLHLVANPSMTTDRDIGSIGNLNVSTGQMYMTISS